MSPDEFKFASSCLDDHSRIIAAGTSQRWDVIKWTVVLNVALATASLAIVNSTIVPPVNESSTPKLILLFTVLVCVIASSLILHCTQRIVRARNDALRICRYFQDNNIDAAKITGLEVGALTGTSTVRYTWRHDISELFLFAAILLLSLVPPLIVIM
jgi:hypothetical protein